jgi:phosphohistidine phosphatase
MKTLYLVRHAKSSWDNANQSDHDRPLNPRGERDAPRMGKRLRKRKDQPEVIISSSAVRAQTTARILATALDYPTSDIAIDERLYGAEPEDVISIIGDLDAGIDCAMLVGHNPTFTALINALGRCDFDNVPTCGMAVLTFPVDSWKDIATIQGKLVDFDFPKNDAK